MRVLLCHGNDIVNDAGFVHSEAKKKKRQQV